MPRKPFPCAVCREPLHPGADSLPEGQAAHARCRGWKARGSVKHGDYASYKKHGCRCGECRAANAHETRRYSAQRKAAGRPIERAVVPRDCEHCDAQFLARLDNVKTGRGRFCSDECARRAQGWDGTQRDRWRPSPQLRAHIIERDGQACQLCKMPVRLDAPVNHPRYPHLDHILPRSRGGSDDEDNLRLACRQCNVMRGSNVDWVPEIVEVAS